MFALKCKKVISVFTVVCIFLSFSVFSVCAENEIPFAGDGTQESPYLIGSSEDMYEFAEIVNGGYSFEGEYIKLISDICLNDISDVENWATSAPENEWTPIGEDYPIAFKGSFDGDNHTVSGVYINADSGCLALFGCMYGGEIKNLTLSDSFISGNGHYVAGIVASQLSSDEEDHNKGLISGCVNNATVMNKCMYTGGVAGDCIRIADCINNGNITGADMYVSGVTVGACRIENCVNNGNVTGTENVAGVCYSTYCERTHDYERGVFCCTNNGTIRYEKNGYSITDVSRSDNVVDCVNNGEMICVSPEVHVHSYTVKAVCQPTCAEQGYTLYVCDCGDSYYDYDVPALPHTPVDIGLKAPTCTTPGWKDGTKCSVCNEILSSAGAIPETGHSGEWITVTDAQIGVDGLEQLKCTVCGEVLEEREIPAIKIGDITGDGKITASDARAVLRLSARLDSGWDIYDTVIRCDIDGDGKITASDARKILRYSAKVDDYFEDFGIKLQ